MTLTEKFMEALQRAETSGNLTDLLELHSDDVTLCNLTDQVWEGKEGAQDFWKMYLENFQIIRSEFKNHQEMNGLGIMEWHATGNLKNGHPLEYRGMSLIEITGDQITAFRTYYDSAAFITSIPYVN